MTSTRGVVEINIIQVKYYKFYVGYKQHYKGTKFFLMIYLVMYCQSFCKYSE